MKASATKMFKVGGFDCAEVTYEWDDPEEVEIVCVMVPDENGSMKELPAEAIPKLDLDDLYSRLYEDVAERRLEQELYRRDCEYDRRRED